MERRRRFDNLFQKQQSLIELDRQVDFDEASTINNQLEAIEMQDRILAHDTATDNPFDSLTSDEQAEYDAWIDECKSGVRDPLPEDFPTDLEYDRIKDEASPSEWEAFTQSTRIRMEANGQKKPEATERDGLPAQMVASDDFPISDDDSQCDCGTWHTHKSYLNTAAGNWLCRPCVEEIDNAERKRKQAEYERLQAEIEFFSDPKNMFAAFLHTKRNGGTQ